MMDGLTKRRLMRGKQFKMMPAVGLVSLAWVMLCLFPQSEAATSPKTECCRCDNLEPKDPPPDANYQVMPSPFKIKVYSEFYRRNGDVQVTLEATGGHRFQSFMLGAYKYGYHYNSDKKPVGQISLLPNQGFKVKPDCNHATGQKKDNNFAIVSDDEIPKEYLRFVWKPNSDTNGHIEFRATFIQDDRTYWIAEKSKVVADVDSKVKLPKSSNIMPIDTSECGYAKGCFREPAGCNEPQCLYILTWQEKGDRMEFELGGLADGARDRYVAVGISEDKYMGDDTVFTCAHTSRVDRTEVFASYNQIDPKRNTPIKKYDDIDESMSSPKAEYGFLINEEGSYRNGRIRCRFTVKKGLGLYTSNQLMNIDENGRHLLFTSGFASRGSPNDPWMKYEDPPSTSADKIFLETSTDHSGWATYPLAKAHGILMIIAWILFNSIGMLLSKYYTKMWPNKQVYEHKYWFLGHVNLLSMAFIITIISVIIIFVETDGWSEAPDLPLKAHPILGIIIFVCILIIPIIALLRPSEPGNCQTIFNWFYWLFCTIANVLAIPNIFIGMDFGKVGVPWWATWILVIWVIFHIIVELTLEIHQCCTHKKNKERRKKYEALKKEYPKQHHPEPPLAGRRFKRFMLSLHVSITILITLIMVIIIAVS